ncbi:MAG: acyl carrier protein [Candidatus Eisenbacteria bacterium]|uniref:Acyl carrier protein n=1 Tax=Eiseniibacteriota bacterium TaxID=2212470 RepID=A0A538TW05_UNCEI|nr:MAG: acyl carrier protein [Candidatus Eisenbacteria bacterium]
MTDALTEQVSSALAAIKPGMSAGITLESTLESLALDSLDRITLLFELEERLKVSIPDEEARGLRTMGDIVDCVRRLKGAETPGT